MLEFIFTILLMLSLGFILYLMVLALPRVAEESAAESRQTILDRWAHSHMPERIDAMLNGFFLKTLRKIRVFTLKLDNTLGKHLKKLKVSDETKKPIDFSDITDRKEEDISNVKK